MGKQNVVVRYEPDDHAVVVADERARVLERNRIMPQHPPIEVADGVFRWAGRTVEPVDDEYGFAVAFAHHVNSRREPTTAKKVFGDPLPGATRWQYAVVNIGMFNTADRMAEVLAAAGAAG